MQFTWEELVAKAEGGEAYYQDLLGTIYADGDFGIEKDFQKAFHWLSLAAESGYARSEYNLGILYLQGGLGEADIEKALYWFQKAADHEYDHAIETLGIIYFMGEEVPENLPKAIPYLRKAAERECPDAEYFLGMSYFHGLGLEKDETLAAYWLNKAAEHGQIDAQYQMGLCYLKGTTVAKDETKAITLLTAAANEGHPDAQYELGMCYTYSIGVTQDWPSAVLWFEKAAKQGFSNAQFQLGRCYELGLGVSLNFQSSTKWFLEDAKQGGISSTRSLAFLLSIDKSLVDENIEDLRDYFDNLPLKDDPYISLFQGFSLYHSKDESERQKAFEYLRLSSERGVATAQHYLGICYYFGRGVEESRSQAKHHLFLSAEKGVIDSIERLDSLFSSDDFKDSISRYEIGADLGVVDDLTHLGFCYENGYGVQKDVKKAMSLYEMASSKNGKVAEYRLGLGYFFGQGVTRDLQKAASLFQSAGSEGIADALFMLGICYEFKFGVPKNTVTATRTYIRAAEKGSLDAMYFLVKCLNDVAPRLAFSLLRYHFDVRFSEKKDSLSNKFYLLSMSLALNDYTSRQNTQSTDDNSYKSGVKGYSIAIADQLYGHFGQMYYDNVNYKRIYSPEKAARFYFLSALRDCAKSQCMLGTLFEMGKGLPISRSAAKYWYEIAAQNGSETAVSNQQHLLNPFSTDSYYDDYWEREEARKKEEEERRKQDMEDFNLWLFMMENDSGTPWD